MVAVFGAPFVFAFADTVDYAPLTNVGQMVIGAVVLMLVWRIAACYRRPVLAVTDTDIQERPL